MTIAQALKKHPKIEADLLLGHVLKQSREFLYMHPDKKLTPKQAAAFENMAMKRKKGMPAAYLLGYKHFYGLKFKVNRDVLIPRPETEWLVDEAARIIKRLRKQNPSKLIKIIDVGTGSGAIAVSIAKAVNDKKIQITATDISEKALLVAKANAKSNKVKINFKRSDLLAGVSGKFNIIIANLPYVPISDYKKLLQSLKYEPKLALTDGTDDFVLISKLLKQAKNNLAPNGIILLETDPASIKLFKSKGKITKDIRGLDRFIRIV
jgi:release factor glutamine methyltransferase